MRDEASLFEFLTAHRISVFDPDTHAPVAQVTYRSDGTVAMRHADGREDCGQWGVDAGTYWTRYQNFRDGTLNRFYLEPIDEKTAQAFFSDGRRAFIQTHRSVLKEPRQ